MLRSLTFIVVLFLFASCTIERRLYSSNQPNDPALEKKNDYSVSATYGGPSGFDLNLGYAITNRFAVIGGLYTQHNRDIEIGDFLFSSQRDSSILSYKHDGYHLGAGYFMPIQKSKMDWFLSFFAGYTHGRFRMNETRYHLEPAPTYTQRNFYHTDITRWFLQTSISYHHRAFHQTLLFRLNHVGYDQPNTDYTLTEQQNYHLPPNGHPRWSQFLDIAFNTKYFFTKDRRIGVQVFGLVNPRLNPEDFNFYYYPSRLGIGFILKPSFILKEKKD